MTEKTHLSDKTNLQMIIGAINVIEIKSANLSNLMADLVHVHADIHCTKGMRMYQMSALNYYIFACSAMESPKPGVGFVVRVAGLGS